MKLKHVHLEQAGRQQRRMSRRGAVVTLITALLISPSKLFLAFHFDGNQRSGYFFSIPGYALVGHVLSTHYVKRLPLCGHLCLKNERCLSFNFGTIPRNRKFLCELSSTDARWSLVNLQKQSEFDYFALIQVSSFLGIVYCVY